MKISYLIDGLKYGHFLTDFRQYLRNAAQEAPHSVCPIEAAQVGYFPEKISILLTANKNIKKVKDFFALFYVKRGIKKKTLTGWIFLLPQRQI